MTSDDSAPADEPADQAEDAGGEGPAGSPDPSDGAPKADGANSGLPPRAEAWRRRSAAGAILTGFALGLQNALESNKERPSIVMETSGDPPDDLPVEADFEYGRPRSSVVQIRPWLLRDNGGDKGAPRPNEDPAEAADPDGD